MDQWIDDQKTSESHQSDRKMPTTQVAGNTDLLTQQSVRTLSHDNKSNNNMDSPRKYATPTTSANFKMIRSTSNHNNNNSSSTNSGANSNNKQISAICAKAKAGQRIMIIMRGAPGSGKSTLAETLLNQCQLLEKNEVTDFVLSTDDYFRTPRGGYVFNRSLLSEAHDWNHRRVRQKAVQGWSPIIVDNTNMVVVDMMPYVQIAVQNGYVLELLEPQTTWCKSASKLAQKNVHQVPREGIQRMLERYENTTVPELLKMLKETKYTVALPQMRLHPPLPAAVPASVTPPLSAMDRQQEQQSPNNPSPMLNVNAPSWVPYEQHAPIYWGNPMAQPTNPSNGRGEKSLLDLLREPATEVEKPQEEERPTNPFQRHSIDCPNEPDAFVLMRQMYPNKQLTGLWDLYVKCNGDVDWAVDILVKEDELNANAHSGSEEVGEQFQCNCKGNTGVTSLGVSNAEPVTATTPKPQRQPKNRRNGPATGQKKELQLQIENCFVLGDEQYSEHTRKIRDIRNGIFDLPLPSAADQDEEIINEEEDASIGDEDDNILLEMDLGEAFVAQLRNAFSEDFNLGESLPSDKLPAKVFLPRSLAKQLYMIWMEAAYNQMEEYRQQTLRDDEQFARLLKNPKYAECSESPANVTELLDMELAWSIYANEQNEPTPLVKQPNDIATHLTKMKLCEKFPLFEREAVLEVFAATGNNYIKTLEVLDSGAQSALSRDELYEQVLRESEKLVQQASQRPPPPLPPPESSRPSAVKSPQLHEEAKNAALRHFEETRNMAAHHSQLKAECYLKAKQAVKKGYGDVALYYSDIAQLHKQKIDWFNHRAANCIMEVHKHTQNNPDLLDLHYLHTVEAISCLDLFLDRHITMLRNCTRVYKHVFIITGRGLHSANGVSTIKNKVKARLGERRLRWQEVNPGLLKVKVFSASRHANNF